jgi:hypothetical protein
MIALTGCGASEPPTSGGAPEMRRLTEAQYRNIIADIFGANIIVSGRFDPLGRAGGLSAISASSAAVTPAAFEHYDDLARSIAAQVTNPKNRDFLVGCKPASATASDRACASAFLTKVGRLLFRRPLTAAELQRSLDVAERSVKSAGGFYEGLSYALAALLEAPAFLFITDRVEKAPGDGALRLTAYSKASRISFLLWNSAPDTVLLDAAEQGELESERGLSRQVDRLLASAKLKAGARAFFTDMLSLDDFDTLSKDPVLYPAFTLAAVNDARESTLRTITDQLIDRHGDYRDLFTTRKVYLTGMLGMVYRLPVAVPDGWVGDDLDKDDPRAGLLAEVGFLALHAHPGRSSATLRGRAVRELILCQKVPDPPGDVNFALVQDTGNPNFKTARQRLDAHRSNPTCAGCHRIMDPIGLAMENFDGAGQFRQSENGAPIDTSGEINGKTFQGTAGLAATLHDDPAAASCLVSRAYQYATGRLIGKDEREWMSYLQKSFAEDGYRFPELLRRIATSKAFFAVQQSPHPANEARAGEAAQRRG